MGGAIQSLASDLHYSVKESISFLFCMGIVRHSSTAMVHGSLFRTHFGVLALLALAV